MPNVWTHIIYGEQIANKANLMIQPQYQNVFRLGTQGPDPFFYYNFWPWKKDKSAVVIGSRLHKEKCGRFLTEMIKYAKKKNDPTLQNYTLGFLSHHYLDRNAHPYIIYKSGEEDHKHQRLEIIIDTLLLKRFQGLEAWKVPVYTQINVGKRLPETIKSMLTELIAEVHEIDKENKEELTFKISQSYQDMIKGLKVLFDPKGYKHKLLGEAIAPFSYSKDFPNRDYLNLNHEVWVHPANNQEKSNDSFYNIFDRAKQEGVILFKKVDQYFKGKESIEAIQQLIGNISYETGKDCNLKLEHRYFDPII